MKIFEKVVMIVLCFGIFQLTAGKGACKEIRAVRIDVPVVLDGLLNEPVWNEAEPVSDFTQRELHEGEEATEKTEVRVLYDKDNLYIGVVCYDSEPGRIIHKELKRDGDLRADDNVAFILDTYRDFRSGFCFSVNPNGARFDALISSGGRWGLNEDWNGVWDAAAAIGDEGWSVEVVIPFKTLRFPVSENSSWGFNLRRIIRRKNEEVLWTAWQRNDGLFQLSKAGLITGLEGVGMGKTMDFKPFTLVGREVTEDSKDNDFKYGLDVKYPVLSNLNLNLTLFTDFAQVEADRTRINLTRFSLRYPEKREFFLEDAATFRFPLPGADVFYSRRIGITPDREQVPVLGGARITGKLGGYRVGVLSMQTDAKHGMPSTNYSVVRVKRDVLEKSSVGFMATELHDASDHFNRVLGTDFTYRTSSFLGNNNVTVYSALAASFDGADKGENVAGGVSVYYPNDLFLNSLQYYFIQENFNPEVGFVRRTGIQVLNAAFRYTPRPNIPHVKKIILKPLDIYYLTDGGSRLLSREYEIRPLGLEFNSGDEFEFNIINNYEYLDEDWNIFGDVIIPKGIYDWWCNEIQYDSSRSRPISLRLRTRWGDFYSGTRNSVSPGIEYKFSRFMALTAYCSYNRIKIGGRKFNTREYSGRAILNFSTRLTSRTVLQWNNEDKQLNLNFLVNYIPKIGSDVYFVYNRIWDGALDYRTTRKTGIFKIAYLMRM